MKLLQAPNRNLVVLTIAVAAALCLFSHLIGFGLLSPQHEFWRSPPNDMMVMLTGQLAVLGEPWRFPLAVSHRLDLAPISIVYTDSIPWLTLALKAAGLGKAVNGLGLYLLISYVLQPLAMMALLLSLGVRRAAALIAGAVLALLYPAWLMRVGHVALTGHWIILTALALSVATAREGLTTRRAVAFALLGAWATGVHAYFLPPVAVCFAASLASEWLQARRGALWRDAVATAFMAVGVGSSALLLGYGVGQGLSGGGGQLGFYAMNLLAPILPQGSALFAQTFNAGWFAQTLDPTGGQYFEGYNYLGAGGVFALGCGVLLSVRHGWIVGDKAAWLRRWGPLVVGLAFLAAFAVGPVAYLGFRKIYELPKPGGALDWLGLFRAHGRFFWAVGYMVVALSLVQIDRWGGKQLAGMLFALTAVLQIVDTREMRAGVLFTFGLRGWQPQPAELEVAPELRDRPWRFTPVVACASDPIQADRITRLSMVAITTGGTTNATATARPRGQSCDIPLDLRQTAAPGDRRLTVVIGPPKVFAPFAERSDCRRLPDGMICGRGIETMASLPPVLTDTMVSGVETVAEIVRFDEGRNPPALLAGWAKADPHGIWSDGLRASMLIQTPAAAEGRPLSLELTAMSFAPPPLKNQLVGVSVNGHKLADWTVEPSLFKPYNLRIPAEFLKSGSQMLIEFDIPGAPAPVKPEFRRLGLGIQKLTVAY